MVSCFISDVCSVAACRITHYLDENRCDQVTCPFSVLSDQSSQAIDVFTMSNETFYISRDHIYAGSLCNQDT